MSEQGSELPIEEDLIANPPEAKERWVADLVAEYLNLWATGKNLNKEEYLNQLPTDEMKDQFKQSVGMGMLLRQALANPKEDEDKK